MNDVLINLDKAFELIHAEWKKKPSKATLINWCKENAIGTKVLGEWWFFQDALERHIKNPKTRKRYGVSIPLVVYDN